MAFLFDKFKDMFKERTGEEFTKNEKEYVIIYFANRNPKSSSKTIFYDAMRFLRAFYPLPVVKAMVQGEVKKAFQKEKAPKSIKKLYKEFAEIILMQLRKKISAIQSNEMKNHKLSTILQKSSCQLFCKAL